MGYQKIIDIAYCDNGDAFKGFTSGAAFFTINIGETEGYYSEILFKAIGNQTFASSSYEFGDIFAPQLTFGDVIKNTTGELNQTLVIPSAKAFDILQGPSSVKVSVQAPNGSYILQNVQADKEYSINLTSYGNYKITYTARDKLFNPLEKLFFIHIADTTSPEVSFSSALQESYQSGSKIIIPSITVNDNVDTQEKVKITVVVYTPSLKMIIAKVGQEIVLDELGEYEIVIIAQDTTGNIGRTSRVLSVG